MLQEHEIRVVHDPSQATACNDLIALDQNRRDRTTIEDLYLEREIEREVALKRIKKEHGNKMIDLFGVKDSTTSKVTSQHRNSVNPNSVTSTSSQVKPRTTAHPSNITSTTTYTSPWAPRNGGTASNTTKTSTSSTKTTNNHNSKNTNTNISRLSSASQRSSQIIKPSNQSQSDSSKSDRHSSAYVPSTSTSLKKKNREEISPRKTSSGSANRPMNNKRAKQQKYTKDDYDDYDDSEEDEDEYDDRHSSSKSSRNNYSSVIQSIFGYNRSK